MKWKLIGALIGLVIGLFLTSWLLSYYVSVNPQATDTDKGAVLFVGLIGTFALGVIGFKVAGDP